MLTEMPWACVIDSVSASLSIRLVLFCLSACICNPPPQTPTAHHLLSAPPLLYKGGRGHPGRRGCDIEPIGRTANKQKGGEETEKVWHICSKMLNSHPLSSSCFLPSSPPSAHPSITHACGQWNNVVTRLRPAWTLSRLTDNMQEPCRA